MSDTPTTIPQLPQYRCRKLVRASKIMRTSVDFTFSTPAYVLILNCITSVTVDLKWVEKHGGKRGLDSLVGGYYVVYDDGYTSWSPAKAFEEGYDRIDVVRLDPALAELQSSIEALLASAGMSAIATYPGGGCAEKCSAALKHAAEEVKGLRAKLADAQKVRDEWCAAYAKLSNDVMALVRPAFEAEQAFKGEDGKAVEPSLNPPAPVRIAPDQAVRFHFKNGPIAEEGVNGVSGEALLAVVADRLECFQKGAYACRENAIALTKIQEAMMWLQKRTRDRMSRGVEGTSAK